MQRYILVGFYGLRFADINKELTMKKFEYYTIHLRPNEDAVQVLDCYGDDGWEAFGIMPDGGGTLVYLKREKQ